MRYSDSVVELIGNTPLVRLRRVTDNPEAGPAPTVLAKLEYFNPGGSVKDRIAVRMVEAAEASGELRAGGAVVEPTSGNTRGGLGIVAQRGGPPLGFGGPGKGGPGKNGNLAARR